MQEAIRTRLWLSQMPSEPVGVPVVEVHISNIFARENYRQQSLTGAACRGAVTGFGLDSYRLAIESFLLPR